MKSIFFCIIAVLLTAPHAFSNDVSISAREIGPEMVRKDFEFRYESSINGRGTYESVSMYVVKYQIIAIEMQNNSNNIVNVNPNHFTMVSNMKTSYPYSSETHIFKDKVKFITLNPFQAVDVYPHTDTSGFLVFERQYEKERPKTLHFKNNDILISTHVQLDPKVKY